MNKDTSGPAFPINANESADRCIYTGMTLRDYFAAKAMQSFFEAAVAEAFTLDQDINCDMAARISYTMADAMLKAREK